jgi:anti-sigma B factor antagonist
MTVSVSTHAEGGEATVSVSGDIDLSSGPSVETAIAMAVSRSDTSATVVDLSGVDFLDSSGISILLKGRRLADQRGVAYRVVGARGMVRTVLDMTGVWAHLSGSGD